MPVLASCHGFAASSLRSVLERWSSHHSITMLPPELLHELSHVVAWINGLTLALLPLATGHACTPLHSGRRDCLGRSGAHYLRPIWSSAIKRGKRFMPSRRHQSCLVAWRDNRAEHHHQRLSPCGHCRQFMNELARAKG